MGPGGYTFGYRLPGTDTAVVLIEVADLAVKAPRRTCSASSRVVGERAAFLNDGDSGLPNLRRRRCGIIRSGSCRCTRFGRADEEAA